MHDRCADGYCHNDGTVSWGNTVLRPISEEDTEAVVRWRNASHVRENLFDQRLITRESHLAWLKTHVHSGRCAQYVILAEGRKGIGTAFLKEVAAPSGHVEFGIFIGDSDALGKGYGKNATNALVEHAFQYFQARIVWLEVMARNVHAAALYRSLGFIDIKRYAKETSKGDAVDVIQMEIRKSRR